MKKFTIIYWSGTGKTEMLAKAIADGVKDDSIQVQVKPVQLATTEDIMYSDVIALGCPAYTVPSELGEEMEEIEDKYMEPYIASLKNLDLSGKKIGLFGTYDWGNGQWMKDWENRMNYYGIHLVDKGLALHQDDAEAEDKAREFGKKLIES